MTSPGSSAISSSVLPFDTSGTSFCFVIGRFAFEFLVANDASIEQILLEVIHV